MLDVSPAPSVTTPPFDADRLDRLLAEAGLDAVVVTSPHNLRCLLGAAQPPAHEQARRVGLSHGLPALAYRRGAPEQTLHVTAEDEASRADAALRWSHEAPQVSTSAASAGEALVRWCAARLPYRACVGVELAHLPTNAYAPFSQRGVALRDADEQLEQVRAVKRSDEADAVRRSAAALLDALHATLATAQAGDAEDALLARLQAEQTARGLVPHRTLAAVGAPGGGEAPRVADGDVVSLAAVASRDGWIASVARSAVIGTPTARQRHLLAQVERVWERTRAHARPDVRGGDLYAAGRAAIIDCEDHTRLSLTVDGIGLLAREAPRLTPVGVTGRAPHAPIPLEAGMALSIAVQLADPVAGLVRVGDTVVVADESGPEIGAFSAADAQTSS